MRLLSTALLLAFSVRADQVGNPVVVELFTSEGCSSCPSADELLLKLDRYQTVPGALVIALEEHVDYWNNLGWTDRFSSPLYRGRQNEYAHVFQTENIYTPQMVVNGRAAFIGDDEAVASREIGKAAEPSQFHLRVQSVPSQRDAWVTDLTVFVRNPGGVSEASDVYLAVTESRLTSAVSQGENAGRQLRHAPVVRSFGVIGGLEAKQFREVGFKSTLKLPPTWKRENLRAVVFVQSRTSRRITAAAVTDLK